MKSLLAASLLFALGLASASARAESTPLGVEALECRGNALTSCEYILAHLDLAVGGGIDETAIENARYRLAALPTFSAVDIYLLRGSSKGQARVVVEVAERDPLAMELVAGSSYYVSSISQRLAMRVAHQNLFGTGEILEALVDARIPIREPNRKALHGRIQFVDPHLFGSRRHYFIAGMSHLDARIDERNGSRFIRNQTGVDVAIGRRIWDFSHVALGYRYNWESNSSDFSCHRRDPCRFDDLSRENIVSLSYGWNSEDDPYFPTQGSRFSAAVQIEGDSSGTLVTGSFGYRKTWRTGGGALLTFNAGNNLATEYRSSFEETFAFGFSYGRQIAALGVHRGRWYVSTGWDQVEIYSDPTEISSRFGIQAGVRVETKSFGVVDLYVIVVGEGTLWGG